MVSTTRMNHIHFGDNLSILQSMPDASIDLIYIDPPFNTGKTQRMSSIHTIRSKTGDRTGFQGNTYKTIKMGEIEYEDNFKFLDTDGLSEKVVDSYSVIQPDASILYLESFLRPRLVEAKRLLKENGSLYFHIDYREVHYCKVLLDSVFGRDSFINEIIWAYDFGGRAKSRWPAKHDNILLYVKNPKDYVFNTNKIDREKYMAPGLVGKEKASKGKLPTDTWYWSYVGKKRVTDTWWQTIVGTNSKERTGYPTQKPHQIIERIIKASSHAGGTVLDFFAGSGTVGESCHKLNRKFILIDNNNASMKVMASRFSSVKNIQWHGFQPNYEDFPVQIDKKQNIVNNQEIQEIFSSDFQKLVSAASHLQKQLEEKSDFWKDSPLEWIQQSPARKKGKLARELIISWLLDEKIESTKGGDTSETIVIDKKRFAIKFSTLWTTQIYKFQQIRNSGYEYLICLGISPYDAHCWVIPKNIAIKNGQLQHKGGSEYWISVDPREIPDWMTKYGGSLSFAKTVIESFITDEG